MLLLLYYHFYDSNPSEWLRSTDVYGLPASGLVVGVLDVAGVAVALERSGTIETNLGTLSRNLALVDV
jgi:hypothetical protein